MRAIEFIKTAVKDYAHVGAITVSSSFIVRRIMHELKPEYRSVVEFGAGDGVITKATLKHLPSDGEIIAIEINKILYHELQQIADSRLTILNDDVNEFLKKNSTQKKVDGVISGIPFSLMSSQRREEIIGQTAQMLTPGGRFIIYQNSPLILPLLKKNFKNTSIHFEPRNIFPYFIMVGEHS